MAEHHHFYYRGYYPATYLAAVICDTGSVQFRFAAYLHEFDMTGFVEILFVIGAAILGAVLIIGILIMRNYILENLMNENEDH